MKGNSNTCQNGFLPYKDCGNKVGNPRIDFTQVTGLSQKVHALAGMFINRKHSARSTDALCRVRTSWIDRKLFSRCLCVITSNWMKSAVHWFKYLQSLAPYLTKWTSIDVVHNHGADLHRNIRSVGCRPFITLSRIVALAASSWLSGRSSNSAVRKADFEGQNICRVLTWMNGQIPLLECLDTPNGSRRVYCGRTLEV